MDDFFIWIACIWLCAAVFLGIGIYAGVRKTPMNFWSGTEVPAEKISSIPAYNKANAIMWCVYSIPFWITGVTYLWFPIASAIFMAVCAIGGIPVLIFIYRRIEKKYRVK